MSQTQTWTVGRLLEWTTDFLRQHKSDSPRLDAEVLLAHARSCQRIQLYTAFAEEPDESVKAAFREMVRRRSEGTPVAYLVGHKEFYSLDFIVSPDVLIPRSETEHLVIEAIDCVKKWRANLGNSTRLVRIADICTGSGCVAIAIAKHVPNVQVLATDISPVALQIATRNVERHAVQDRIALVEADLFGMESPQGNAQQEESLFDIVVSNPPYVSEAEFAELPKSVREHEPKLALVASNEGMGVIERLMAESLPRIRSGGYLMMELSPMIAKRVENYIATQAGWKLEKMTKDLAGHPRIAVLKRD